MQRNIISSKRASSCFAHGDAESLPSSNNHPSLSAKPSPGSFSSSSFTCCSSSETGKSEVTRPARWRGHERQHTKQPAVTMSAMPPKPPNDMRGGSARSYRREITRSCDRSSSRTCRDGCLNLCKSPKELVRQRVHATAPAAAMHTFIRSSLPIAATPPPAAPTSSPLLVRCFMMSCFTSSKHMRIRLSSSVRLCSAFK